MAIPVVVYWCLGLVGVPLEGLRIGVTPRTVVLTSPPPATIHTDQLALSGTTQPLALITTTIDGSRLPFATAGEKGDFQLTVDIGRLGVHQVRIEVAYASPDRPDELLEFTVTRVPDVLPTPQIVAVEQLTDPTSFAVLVRSTPRTTIVAIGADVDPPAPRVDDAGRAEIKLHVGPGVGAVTLAARDDQGGTSAPTAGLDLGALAAAPSPSAASASQAPPFDQADWKVTYRITRDGVSRTQSVVVDKHRREVIDLTRGTIDAATFIQIVGGPAGLAPSGSFGCLVSGIRPSTAQVEIGDRATVTVTDDFPDLLTSWNGLTDRPRISLCFPTGFPGLGNTGSIELAVRDYSIASVTGEVESAQPSQLPGGGIERTDTWASVPRDGAIDVGLSLDTPSMLAALPTIRPRTVIPDEGAGPLLLSLIDALIHGAGVLLLMWAVSTRTARATVPEGPRRALGDVLTLGAGILFLPVFGELQAVGLSIANYSSELLKFSGDIKVDPSIVGRWFVAIVVVIVSLVAWFVVRRRVEFIASVLLALAAGAGGWLAISILAWIAARTGPSVADLGAGASTGVRIAVWLIGAAVLAVVVVFLFRRFGAFLGFRNRVSLGHDRLAQVGWAVVLAMLLAVPAGTGQRVPTTPEDASSYIETTVTGLAALIAFAYTLVAIGAVAFMVRCVWKRTPWERSVPVGPASAIGPSEGMNLRRAGAVVVRDWLAPLIGRALFAGFVIGTAGVLLPIPFFLALFFFGFLLRPAADVVRLAAEAGRLRAARKTMLAAALGDLRASWRLEREYPDAPVGPAELAPESSIWDNTRLALRVALVLLIPLAVVYVARYPFASMTRQDEYFIQRFVLNVVTFAGTWLTIALLFALLFEYLRGTTGVRKGIWLGVAILLFTVPWQLLSGLATTLSPVAIGIHVFEVITFTGLIGAVFDLRLLQQGGHVQFGRPRQLLTNVGVVAGMPDLAAAIGLIVAALATTALSLLTGQVTQLLTRVLSPFLPLPPGGGP